LDLWSTVLNKISEKISKPSFDTWFAGTKAEIIGEMMVVKANNSFAGDWLEERYKTLIFETTKELSGKPYEIKIMDMETRLEKETPTFKSYSSGTSNTDLKNLIEEQNSIIVNQQGKIEDLEKRIQVLEQQIILNN
jgi:chromosomal replication initiation ATPase DnaA